REVGDLISRGRCQWLAMWPTFKGLPFQQILDDVGPAQLRGLKGVMVVGESSGQELVRGAPSFSYTLTAPNDALKDLPPAPGDTHALVYTTSGTTSQSKLVVHDQQTLISHGQSVARYFGIERGDAVLLGAPLCGAFGFSTALGGLAAGAPLVSAPVLDPAECAKQ